MRGALPLPHGLRTLVQVLGAEGPRAARDRALDRLGEWRRRRRFRPAGGPVESSGLRVPLLNVLPTPPASRLGGVQAQFLRRIPEEARARPVALLYPERGGYRLEVEAAGRRAAWGFPGPVPGWPPPLSSAAFEDAVLRATRALGAGAVHFEGLAGFPLASLRRAREAGLRLFLSAHDFGLVCQRPHLLELPAGRFCHYCRDLARCQACLSHDRVVPPDFQATYREVSGALLRAAEAVVYPSAFLRTGHLEFFAGLDPGRHRVIELTPPPSPAGPAPGPRQGAGRHLAYVGLVHALKGALVFEQVVRQLGATASPPVRWSVFGGGDADLLRRLRGLPRVRVRGYYRANALPALLRREHVDWALLLSIVPEAYLLTLDECRAAGVPVIAFDHGAVGDRLRRHGGGILVPPQQGARGVLDVLRGILAGRAPALLPGDPAAPAAPPRGAAAHLALYAEHGVRL